MAAKSSYLMWVDLEMTGLDDKKDHIMEFAAIITDSELNVVEEFNGGESIAVQLSDSALNSMNEWCTKHHGENGLTDRCRKSPTTIQQIDSKAYEWAQKHFGKGQVPLAGNSVYMDRIFMRKEMPLFESHLHYRIVDVSTIKELYFRWYPTAPAFQKQLTHKAMDDIKESLEELRFYRKTIFKT
eukprot:TRINITY_DN275_c0_g1_i1.p1 TRINITY_DN275_c0_g1~~TRINITY_DN275_c0_g1_i1.p1  ORF type:complete len:215 (+),score=54.28 TRINITY_DN275_c0_g1_i1:96-647(+)